MYQAIVAKYRYGVVKSGPRIIASCQARRITVPYKHELSVGRNKIAAAQKLATLMNWDGPWFGGYLPSGQDVVFVQGSGVPGGDAAFVVEEGFGG